MNMNFLSSLSKTMAEALLVSDGEISLGQIRALPFVEDETQVENIVNSLVKEFETEYQLRRTSSSSISEWEEVIILKGRRTTPIPESRSEPTPRFV